jgi:hypothetical protein
MSDEEILLIDRWRDGELSSEERAALVARLRDDAAFRTRFAEEARLQGLIAALLPGGADEAAALQRRVAAALDSDGDDAGRRIAAAVAARVRRMPARPLWRRLAPVALAACLVLAAGGVWLWSRPDAAAIARVASLDGEAALARDGARRPLSARATLHRGDAVEVQSGSVELRYDDGTTITAVAPVQLTLDDEAGAKRVRLDYGELRASVAKQPSGRAMVLSTPLARATVVGTRFTLSTALGGSRLAVDEGRVAFAPLATGDGVEVAAGEVGEVGAGAASLRHAADDGLMRWAAALATVVPSTPAERAWERIGWVTDLWEARRRARAEGRPILLWTNWGDPLAMAPTDCLVDRATWSDPELQRLIAARFVAAAADCWFLQRREDAVGRFFASLARQSPHPEADNHEGIYCLDADGRLLAFCGCASEPSRLRETLDQALAAFAPTTAEIPFAGPVDTAHDPRLPGGAVVALASARWVVADGDGFRACGGSGREACWLAPSDCRGLAPEVPRVGERSGFSDILARKVARFVLLDTTRGESSPWDVGDLRSVELTSAVDTLAPRLRLCVTGHLALADAHRSYSPRISGVIELAADGAIARLDLLALGPYREDGLRPPTPDAQLGVAIRIAEPGMPLGHPHGMREAGYFAP